MFSVRKFPMIFQLLVALKKSYWLDTTSAANALNELYEHNKSNVNVNNKTIQTKYTFRDTLKLH